MNESRDEGRAGAPGRGVPWGVVVPVLLVAGVLLAFSPSFGGELLAWDDRANLVENTNWKGLGPENLWWMATTFHMGHYQPLTWLSFGLQNTVGASSASAMHVVNVLLHAVNAVLFFWVCRRLLRLGIGGASEAMVTLGAGLAAGLFAMHPLRAESVAWVTERRDVLSAAFLLGSALAYLKSVDVGKVEIGRVRWYAVCILLLMLSCLSKAWGMSFFVVLLAMDVYPLRRLPMGDGWLSRDSVRVMVQKWPMAAIGLVTAWVASLAQRETSAVKTLEQWSVMDRLVQSAYGLLFYVKQTVAPSGLSPLYQLPKRMELGPNLVAVVFALALIAAVVWCWRKHRAVSVALLAYVVLIGPVLGVLQSGEQLVADRYSYLATMPLVLLVAAGVVLITGRKRAVGSPIGGALAACGVIVIAALGLRTYAQTAVWRTTEALWEHAAKVTPTSMVLVYYGGTLQEQGKIDEARAAYEEAIKVNPEDGRAMLSLGVILESQGRGTEAERAYLAALPHLNTLKYRAHLNLGVMYLRQGKGDEALKQLEAAIAEVERPGHKRPSGSPYMMMAMAKEQMGDRAGAVALLRRAMGYPDSKEMAEQVLGQMGERP